MNLESMVELRALIVDDEPLAREGVRMLLEKDPSVKDVQECADGPSAVRAIVETKPNLVFLDVQMPEMDGFDVLAAVGAGRMPSTIFVTAHDKYALQAFEVHALDYLLKPFTTERFFSTLQRAKSQISRNDDALVGRLAALLTHHSGNEERLVRLSVKVAGRICFVNVDDIDWIEAADPYVCLHVRGESHLVRGRLSVLEARLDRTEFLRIHRSTIINLRSIRELQPLFHGEYAIRLRDGTELTSSRSYSDKVRALIANPL